MSVRLKMENLSKVYDKTIALNNVNLEVQAGEFVCLLGPSGCGKSTFLRIIAGLDTPTHGKIFINDRDVTHLPPPMRNFGIMFQSYALFPNLTAFENVAYGLRNKKIRKADIDKRVDRLFDMIRLSHAKDRLPAQLSGGEQQRVALARALATEPDYLLLDEPLSALDAKVRLSLRKEICQIQRELELTTIMVTHDQDEALTMADRIVVMNKACIMQTGTPQDIYDHPKSPFVADFIGSINFLDPAASAVYGFVKGEEAAIRPEKIRLTRERSEDSTSAIVEGCEFRGSFYRVSVRVSHIMHQDLRLDVDVPSQSAKRLQLETGEKVYITLQQEDVLQFEPVTETRGRRTV